jgi:hypothetical protein
VLLHLYLILVVFHVLLHLYLILVVFHVLLHLYLILVVFHVFENMIVFLPLSLTPIELSLSCPSSFRLLDETEKKRERLKELSMQARARSGDKRGSSSSGGGGEEALHAAKKLKVEMWNDALKTASGEHGSHVAGSKESEARLKKALKRIEKKKQKSTNEWADRLEKGREDKDARIKKKEDNLSARKDKKDFHPVAPDGAKQKDAAAPRPGFEGKKKDFLNKTAKGLNSN